MIFNPMLYGGDSEAGKSQVFGVVWNYGEPSSALERLTTHNDPNGFVTVNVSSEPVPAVGTATGTSPFDGAMPWAGMEEYSIIDQTVCLPAADGSDRITQDTMVYIPEFYFKILDDDAGTKRYFYVADRKRDGFTKHPGSNQYVGRYNTIDGYYSKSGAKPLLNMKRTAARTSSKAKGAQWGLYDYAAWCAVWLLYLVEFADWNSQNKIGFGIMDSGYIYSSGSTDAMVYHTGRVDVGNEKTAVQYRHIENPWGNIAEWIDGVIITDGAVFVSTRPEDYGDFERYNYVNIGTRIQSEGWITMIGLSPEAPWAFYPTGTEGSSSTYIPDKTYFGDGRNSVSVGGTVYTNAGLLNFDSHLGVSSSSSKTGARLMFHP